MSKKKAKASQPNGKRSTKDTMKLFVKSMNEIAKELDIPASEVTKAKFFANDPYNISEWEIRSRGRLTPLKNMHFPREGNLVIESTSKLIQKYRNKINNELGTHAALVAEFKESLSKAIGEATFHVHKPTKKKRKKKKVAGRTIVAHISDTHFGVNVDKNEVGGLNEYNWTIAARRMAMFMQQVVSYKPQYRNNTDLVLCINGDIIGGMIHDQEHFVDLLTTQFAGTLNILIQAISYAAKHYQKVKVVLTPGNHGRAMHKTSKGRAATHKWDSYETQIYIALKEVLKAKCPNVEVDIPLSPYGIFTVHGHNFFVTHGDTVLNVGNPGSAINIKAINNQINKLNASKLARGQKFAGALVGHVHTPTVQMLESGCMLLINGCLSGLDPFANSIGIFDSNPTQKLFEVTEAYPVGDIRMIQVASADKDASLDAIIKPFDGPIGD